MSREEDKLEDVVRFGAEAEAFLKTDIGKYLLQRSQDQIDQAFEQLKRVDPCEPREIRKLQNIIQRNEDVETWLGEIIQAGRDARDLLSGEEL